MNVDDEATTSSDHNLVERDQQMFNLLTRAPPTAFAFKLISSYSTLIAY